MTPRVTVLMSVFNGAAYLREAIDSILAQTFTDFELLIVDDGSTDETPAILHSYADPRMRVLTNERNLGLTASLNRGLREARGEWIARQDADDRSHPDRLRRQLEHLDAHPEVMLLGTHARLIDARGRVTGTLRKPVTRTGIAWASVFHNPFIHSSVMFRRGIGTYDESYPFNQDFELWSRLLGNVAMTNLDAVLIDYRAHTQSIAGRRDAAVLQSRIENTARNQRIQHRNVLRETGSEELANEWPALWTAINVPWLTAKPSRPRRAPELIERLWENFRRVHPEAAPDDEVRAITRSALMVVARYLLTRDPLGAWRAYRGASVGLRFSLERRALSPAPVVASNAGLRARRSRETRPPEAPSFRTSLRAAVEHRAPALAAAYRSLREEILLARMKARRTPFGFLLAGDVSMQNGTFEPEETRLIRELLERADRLIDVGANAGYYTGIARAMNKDVIAIEPQSANCRLLMRNIALNQWTGIEIWPMALGAKPGLAPLYGRATGATMVAGWSGASTEHRQIVPVTTLDTILRNRFHGERLLIKIDVEGAEYDVLLGATRTAARVPRPVWLVEATYTVHRRSANDRFLDTFDFFWSRGYECRTANGDVVTREQLTQWIAQNALPAYNWWFA